MIYNNNLLKSELYNETIYNDNLIKSDLYNEILEYIDFNYREYCYCIGRPEAFDFNTYFTVNEMIDKFGNLGYTAYEIEYCHNYIINRFIDLIAENKKENELENEIELEYKL
jgi:hypothetical protein